MENGVEKYRSLAAPAPLVVPWPPDWRSLKEQYTMVGDDTMEVLDVENDLVDVEKDLVEVENDLVDVENGMKKDVETDAADGPPIAMEVDTEVGDHGAVNAAEPWNPPVDSHLKPMDKVDQGGIPRAADFEPADKVDPVLPADGEEGEDGTVAAKKDRQICYDNLPRLLIVTANDRFVRANRLSSELDFRTVSGR